MNHLRRIVELPTGYAMKLREQRLLEQEQLRRDATHLTYGLLAGFVAGWAAAFLFMGLR